MVSTSLRSVTLAVLVGAVALSPIVLGGDYVLELLSIPGYWQAVGDSVEPDGILAPFGDDTVHRPAIAIQPGTGEPAAVVHRHGVWNLAGVSDEGDLFRVDRDSGQSAETIAGDPLFDSFEALAFDSNNDVFYELWTTGGTATLVRIDVASDYASSSAAVVADLGLPFTGLAFDPDLDVLYAVWVELLGGLAPSGPDGGDRDEPDATTAEAARMESENAEWFEQVIAEPTPMTILTTPRDVHLYCIAPQSGQKVLVATYQQTTKLFDRVTALAFDPGSRKLYAVIYSGVDTGNTGYQLARIKLSTAEPQPPGTTWGPAWGEAVPVEGLAFVKWGGAAEQRLYGTYTDAGPLVEINPTDGTASPVGPGIAVGLPGLAPVRRQQDGLFYLEFNGALWQSHLIDNEQDDSLLDGYLTHAAPPNLTDDPDQGRIDGISLTYAADDSPLVAWAQRVNDLYSDILVAVGTNGPNYAFGPLGEDAFGTPSNRMPGISRTLRDSTDPVIVLDAADNPVVGWLEETSGGDYEVYVRRYDPVEDQWLEMGDFSASGQGVSLSGGTADSFDLALYDGQVILAHPLSGDIQLRAWDELTEEWTTNGFGWTPVQGNQPTIAVYPGTPILFVAWIDEVYPNVLVLGRQFDGADWVDVGPTIHQATELLNPAATTTPGGRLVVAWQEYWTTPWDQILAKQWDGELWSEIGPGSSSSGGISGSPVDSTYPRLTTGPDSRPVIAWEEDGRAFVRKFTDSLGGQPDCNGNLTTDLLDIMNGTSPDCNTNGLPDECEIDAAGPAPGGPFFCTENCDPDCNTNGIPDACDLNPADPDENGQVSDDCNTNDIPDECEPDCDNNNIADDCDIRDCPGGQIFCQDCNTNGVPDGCDVGTAGASNDCNTDGIPDECTFFTYAFESVEGPVVVTPGAQPYDLPAAPLAESDVLVTLIATADLDSINEYLMAGINSNGLDLGLFFQTTGGHCSDPPDTEGTTVTRDDYNAEVGGSTAVIRVSASDPVTPSSCDPEYVKVVVEYQFQDCNQNGILDSCDVISGYSPDCNTNGIPDECENDCNGNCMPDECDIDCGPAAGPCDLAGCGGSSDTNTNGIPDECETAASCAATGLRSLKGHGAAGELSLNLGLSDGIEPRTGQVDKLEIDLDDASSVNVSDTVQVNCSGAWSGSATVTTKNGNTVTVEFSPALPNQAYCVITMDCGAEVCVRMIEGDMNRSGDTNTTDVSAVKGRFGQTPTDANCEWDFNRDGSINTTDYSSAKARFGMSAPTCP